MKIVAGPFSLGLFQRHTCAMPPPVPGFVPFSQLTRRQPGALAGCGLRRLRVMSSGDQYWQRHLDCKDFLLFWDSRCPGRYSYGRLRLGS